MMRFSILLFVFSLLLLGCTGDESTEVDKTPPFKPDLLHHLGDNGDGGITYQVLYPEGASDVQLDDLNDDNNGIDAVAGGDWIRLQWAPFVDTDVDFVKVFRFYKNAWTILGLTQVDSVRAGDGVTYLDATLDDPGNTPTNTEWYYYIDVYDTSGNHTISDTVSYFLLEKPQLRDPSYYAIVDGSNLTFEWIALQSNSISMYRVLLFDENHERFWFFDQSDTDPDDQGYLTAEYDGAPLLPGTYFWRVDAFGEQDVTLESGMGSESLETEFFVE